MTKQELVALIKKLWDERKAGDAPDSVTVPDARIQDPTSEQILQSYPYLHDTLVDLMSPEYKLFVSKVDWIAPKPTTFRIVLQNGNYFFLTWNKNEFIAKVKGSKYDLSSMGDELRAVEGITDLLVTGPFNLDKDYNTGKEGKDDTSSSFSNSDLSGQLRDNTPPEGEASIENLPDEMEGGGDEETPDEPQEDNSDLLDQLK